MRHIQNTKVQLKYSLEKGKLAVTEGPYKYEKQIKFSGVRKYMEGNKEQSKKIS